MFNEKEDRIAAAILAAVFLLLIPFLSQLQHLPGPLYGGDLYAHLGFTKSYLNNNFWTDPYFVGEVPFYPWFGNVLIAALSFITGMSLMKAMIWLPLITVPLSMFGYYLLGSRFFRSKSLGIGLMLLSFFTRGIVDAAPNLTAWMLAVPFLFYFWLRFEDSKSWKDVALAGIFLGVLALTQVAFFIAGTALFAAGFLIKRLEDWKEKKFHQKKYLVDISLKAAAIAVIGILIALLFYGPIIVKYHAKAINPLFTYNGTDINLLGIGWVMKIVFQSFFNFSGVVWFIYGILALLGLVVCIGNWKKEGAKLALIFLSLGVLLPLHHLITRPLLETWILPSHVLALWFPLLLLSVYGIQAASSLLSRAFKAERKTVLLVAFAVLAVLFIPERISVYNNDSWVQYGRQIDPATQAWLDAGRWIEQNTDKNAVFLTNDETCFAMNGVSGRKCVFVRRTHANYFVDVERRYADGVVMLYGKDKATIDSLIRQYGVGYLLIDPYMMQAPIKIRPQYEQYLKENGVEYVKGRERLDPSVPDAAVFDLLFVPPQSPGDAILNRSAVATTIYAGGQPYMQILKLN